MSKWYQGGLAFSCQGCGNCCSGPQEGYVWVTRQEMRTIADYLNLTEAEFKSTYLRRVGIRYSLLEEQSSKDCICLTPDGKGGKKCVIYPVRPIQCRTWPFWKENLRSRHCWNEAAENCPGIDNGQWSDIERIEKMLRGDPSAPAQAINLGQAARAWINSNINNRQYLTAVNELYVQIERVIAGVAPSCDSCGQCCDFDRYGHRLYVTTLEMLYFQSNTPKRKTAETLVGNGEKTSITRCPYQQDAICTARTSRPASCRIFYCKALPVEFQNELTEKTLKRLRLLHERFAAPYYYADIRQWLENND